MKIFIYTGLLCLYPFACRSGKALQESNDSSLDTASEDLSEEDDTSTTDTTDSGTDESEEDDNTDDAPSEEDDKPEDELEDTGDKPENDDYQECQEDFEPTQPCVGDWMETICISDGLIWWCEDGIWTNEDSKPD